jgi:hypothetical protein
MEFHRMLNDGFIVAHDEWLDMAVRWNGSATFELFSEVRPGVWALVETFMDFNARGGNQDYARKVARLHFDGIYDRMEQEEAA